MSNSIWSRGAILASVVFLASCVNAVASDENTAVACGDNLDNDLDGSADCLDIECQDFSNCNTSSLEDCVGGADEDNDNRVDCQDPDCLDGNPNNSINDKFCTQNEICDDLEDNDGDGLTDCNDPSCNGDPNCPEEIFEVCENGTDDDQDGFTDCEDTECAAVPACNTPGQENCSNGLDDDGDTFADCDDAECLNAANCVVPGVCGDNLKNQASEQCDGPDLGVESCTSQGFASGTLSCNADCTLNTSACVAAPNCGNGNIDAGEQCDGANLAGQNCAARGFAGGNLACSSGCQFDTAACFNVENCVNGIDDDNDGQTDCADAECAAAPSCNIPDGSCAEPVIGLSSNSGNTTGKPNILTGGANCEFGALTGPDFVFSVTSSVTGTASLVATPGNQADIGILVYSDCNSEASNLGCIDDFIAGTAETAAGPITAGVPIFFVVSGFGAADSGPFTLTISIQ